MPAPRRPTPAVASSPVEGERPARLRDVVRRVAQSEGARAVRERLLDHLAEARRRFRYRHLESGAAWTHGTFPVLDLTAAQPVPWLGGSQLLLGARLEREGARRPLAMLYPDRANWRLELRRGAWRAHLRFEAPAPSPSALELPEQVELVGSAVDQVGAELIHLHGLAGWSPRALLAVARRPVRLIVSLHDFSGFCLRPHLFALPDERFCDFSRDAARCARCLAQSWSLPDGFQSERRTAMAELLGRAEALLFPSTFLAQAYDDLFPALPARRLIVPPTSSAGRGAARRAPLSPPRHLALVGSVQPHKGADVFERLVRSWSGPPVRWSSFGNGDPVWLDRLRGAGVTVRGYYRTGTLTRLLVREQVDAALMLSVVPESYGLVLDECAAAGVPVVAFAHGALAERLPRFGAGRLVALEAGVAGVMAALAEPFPSVTMTETPDAVEAHLELYRSLGLL